MSVRLEFLDRDNAEYLQNIGADVFDHAIEPRYLDAFLDDPRHVMVIAIDDELVVGMASAVEYFHPDKPPQLWINEVGVASSHRNLHIGRKLTGALVNYAEEHGCVFAWLGTDTDNFTAQRCFASVPEVEAPQTFLLYEWDLEE